MCAPSTGFAWKYSHYYVDSPDDAATNKAWIINSYHMFVRILIAAVVGLVSILMFYGTTQSGEWAATILHRPDDMDSARSKTGANALAGSAVRHAGLFPVMSLGTELNFEPKDSPARLPLGLESNSLCGPATSWP